jgi:hypothetical protein
LEGRLYKVNEKVLKAREIRKKLIQRAATGDKEAQEILSKPPYFMKVYSELEKQEYQDSKSEEDGHRPLRVVSKKPKAGKEKKRGNDSK